jgi:hypothetical protein
MMPLSLSSTPRDHIHTTFPPSRNWTTLPPRLLLPRHHYLHALHLHLWRAPWNSTPSPDKLFPIKRNTSHTQLRLRRHPCLSHIVKRGRTAPPPSEFFGPCHSRAHSATHHLRHHRHHGTSLKYLRTMLHSRGDASFFRLLRHSLLHKSTFRSSFTFLSLFVISFLITVRIY